ncbi:MAG: Amuc_1100 family pilus-like protein [Puniceicoccales bacterium]|jgi:hypothetical protein|nr:Amuc_1100 family pilus-like protein [Puniceicoccales bacterium]
MEKKQKVRIALALAVLAVTLVLGFFYVRSRSRTRELDSRCNKLYGEILLLARSYGNCAEVHVEEMEAVVARSWVQFQRALGDRQREELETPPSTTSWAEFYFDLVEESKRLVELAGECAVVLLDGERFGFGDTVREGRIEEGAMEQWRGEIRKIGTLLSLLFRSSAGDLRFQSISRGSASLQELSAHPNDLFDSRPVPTLRPILDCETSLYRLQFQCHTATLRHFLNALEDQLLPAVLRNIRVTVPVKPPGADPWNRWLLVDPQPVQCTVFLEWVQLLPGEEGR